jgi:tRNA 2-thiouridine synthesizing protein A
MSDPKSPTPLVADTIDATGLKCPEPVMMLRNALRNVDAGVCIKLVATDPSTLRDIPTMCRFMHHQLVSEATRMGVMNSLSPLEALNHSLEEWSATV